MNRHLIRIILPLCLLLLLCACTRADAPAVSDPPADEPSAPSQDADTPAVPDEPSADEPSAPADGGWSEEALLPEQTPDEERDIYGVEFRLTYDADGDRFVLEPLMGDCDKIRSCRLSADAIEVVLDGRFELLYTNIPATVALVPAVNEYGYDTYRDWYTRDCAECLSSEGDDYLVRVPFDRAYERDEVGEVRFTFGKID